MFRQSEGKKPRGNTGLRLLHFSPARKRKKKRKKPLVVARGEELGRKWFLEGGKERDRLMAFRA